jgi:hypothetical protein
MPRASLLRAAAACVVHVPTLGAFARDVTPGDVVGDGLARIAP